MLNHGIGYVCIMLFFVELASADLSFYILKMIM